MGLTETLANRIKRYDMGYMVNDHLIASTTNNEIAFGVATKISIYRDCGITYAGPLPDESQIALEYQTAKLVSSDNIESVAQFFEFLISAEARTAFTKTGVDN